MNMTHMPGHMPGMNMTQMPGMNTTQHHHMPTTTTNPHMHHTTTVDHSAHGGSAAGHGNFFETGFAGITVLFEPFLLKDDTGLAVACVVLFVVSVLYEGLKVMREVLLQRSMSAQRRATYSQDGLDTKVASGHFNCAHLLQSVLHLVQVSISYLLMLAVMTFNLWIGLSVVLGAGVGYLMFAWKRRVVQDLNEHCN